MIKDVINDSKILGKNLKKLRQISELKISEVSKQCGISESMISQVESGKKALAPIRLRSLLNVYNYSLGLFISHIHDEYDDFFMNFDEVHGKKENSLLLAGSRNENEFGVLMTRPNKEKDKLQIVEISLEPQQIFPIDHFTIDDRVKGYVSKGELLLEFKNDEFMIKAGEEFEFDGSIPHNYRNFTSNQCVFILILETTSF